MKIEFTKMQAFGNDYIYIDAIRQTVPRPEELARRISDRHFGAGSDGMILVCPSERCDYRMRVFNPDGSEAEMCGNALRSSAKFYYLSGYTSRNTVTVETLGGEQQVDLIVEDGEVTDIHARICRPEFSAEKIPVRTEGKTFLDQPLTVADRVFRASSLSFGNPHTVLFVDPDEDLYALPLEKYGRAAECLPCFPRRTNVTFAQVVDESHIRMREWERNCGETIGCATGCCAAVVAASLCGLCGRQAEVRQPGGVLKVEWDAEGFVHMTGPAFVVYRGEYEYEPDKDERDA